MWAWLRRDGEDVASGWRRPLSLQSGKGLVNLDEDLDR